MIPVRSYQHQKAASICNEVADSILECKRSRIIVHLYWGKSVLVIEGESKAPLEMHIPRVLTPCEWEKFWNNYNIEYHTYNLT